MTSCREKRSTKAVREDSEVFEVGASFHLFLQLVISDPLAIAYIFQKQIFNYYHSAVVQPRVSRLLGKSLGWVEGESEHRRMKKLVSSSLTNVFHNLVNTVQSTGNEDSAFNILPWTNKAILNVIGHVAFLHDFEEGESAESQQILQAQRRAVSAISQFTNFIVLMLLHCFPLLNHLLIAALQAQGAVKLTIQSGVAKEMIRQNEKSVNPSVKVDHPDLLSNLCFIAGQETTSQTIAFSVLELSQHPRVQSRLRLKFQTIQGKPTYDDFLTKFLYLDVVLRETLRLYPPLPYFERVSTKLDIIPLRYPVKLSNRDIVQEVHLGLGQTVIIPTMSLQRLDSIWEDGDPLPPQEKLCSGWSNTLAFSDRPRTCPGHCLTIFKYKVILSALIAKFQLDDAGLPMTYSISSSLQPFVKGREDKGPQIPVKLTLL
ncbi:hypothetical protein GYMLUDRAFT_77003 [Collybiopsis luxurians FD-317 M1]|uniref:Cytochrome P450 n=1 Tax=Collybiopsis luxurians FD-317 M1 TaxID=944289 RepID=A0A0D0BIS8_9AGAR|nr:hypothetical protein GYMLUDRAFT_77003 [Collybiopsis luxurians FD-317 M1]